MGARVGIRQKAIALFVLATLLPLIAASVGAYLVARSAVHDIIEDELALVTRSTLRTLEGRLAGIIADIQVWSSLELMQAAAEGDVGSQVEEQLRRFRQAYPAYAEIVLTDQAGQVLAATRPGNAGRSIAAEPMLNEAIAGRVHMGGPRHTDLAQGEPVLPIAVPVAAAGDSLKTVGTLVGLVNWREIERILSTASIAGMPQSERVVLALLAADPDEGHGAAGDPPVEADGPCSRAGGRERGRS